jgi:YVTN family beta-propeller protein
LPKRSALLLQIGLVLLGGLSCASAQTNWKVEKTFHVGGEGGWDYVTVDSSHHRLFVTRSTHTMAIDTETGKVLGDIPGQIRSHGVALVPKLGRGFITDGGGKGAIVVFDLKSYAVIGQIPAMPDADGIIYDAKLDRVLAVSGDGNALMTFRPDLDPKRDSIDPPIALGGAPEFLASDGSGKIYVNLVDKDTVAVVDLQTRKVTSTWPVKPAGHPVGMAIDAANHRIFVGTRNPQKLVVMNAETGAIESSLPIGAGVDANAFSKGQAFSSCGDGTLVIAETKDGSWGIAQTVKTAAGARTMGLDGANGHIYLPTAELEPVATGRPKPKPGTFMIVVVGH